MVATHEANPLVVVRRIIVRHPEGMHLRICSLIAQQAVQFEAQIRIYHGVKQADARSILELLSLAAEADVELILKAHGPGAEDALEAIAAIL